MASYIEIYAVYQTGIAESHGCSSWYMACQVIEDAIGRGFKTLSVREGVELEWQIDNVEDAHGLIAEAKERYTEIANMGATTTLDYADLRNLIDPVS